LGQAKAFTDAEFERLLAFLATQPHAARNRAMVLMTFWAGLRVGEVAQLRFGDVFDGEPIFLWNRCDSLRLTACA
jgi:integrase/recombinase XerD